MATWNFSNDYLEEILGADLDNSGVIGDGTPGNATAPANLSSATYAAGDDYLAEGTLASVAALDKVKTLFSEFNTVQGISFDAPSAYKYTNVKGTAADLKTLSTLSSTDLGNITGILTVSDSYASPTSLSDLQSIKDNFGGNTFTYYGVKGTTKELADARNDSGFDWIKNITSQSGTKSFTLTDLSLDGDHQAALIGTGNNALDNTYLITQNGLTSNATAYLGAISSGSIAYLSDATPDATTSYLAPVTSSEGQYSKHVIGLANKQSPNPATFADFNVTGDDAASGLSLTTHFYGGEQLSHIYLSGGDLSTTNGYSYQQTAGASTSDLSDDIWTLRLNLQPGQPAISGSVPDNSNSSILGLVLHTIDSTDVGTTNDLGASVFRTQAWWNDISANDPNYKFSDICPGVNIDGINGNAIEFDFYLGKSYLERTFSTDFDAIQGGFAASGLSSISSANESTGSYIDVSKSGAISSLKLPVTISDVSATTAGGSTDLYQVAFSNDSWSKGNLSLVYGPSVASTITGDTSGSGAEDTTITGDLNATDPQGLTDSTYFSIETGNGPTNGSASIDPASGEWSYTPTANFKGTDSFTVTVTDDLGGTTPQEIAVTVTAEQISSPSPSTEPDPIPETDPSPETGPAAEPNYLPDLVDNGTDEVGGADSTQSFTSISTEAISEAIGADQAYEFNEDVFAAINTDNLADDYNVQIEVSEGLESETAVRIVFSLNEARQLLDTSGATEGGGTVGSNAPSDVDLLINGVYFNSSAGNDDLTGSNFSDFIRAGAGDDIINGGSGNDLIRGGSGSDQITLGEGADIVYYTIDQLDGSTDTITDLGSEDQIRLGDGIQVRSQSTTQLVLEAILPGETREVTVDLLGLDASPGFTPIVI